MLVLAGAVLLVIGMVLDITKEVWRGASPPWTAMLVASRFALVAGAAVIVYAV